MYKIIMGKNNPSKRKAPKITTFFGATGFLGPKALLITLAFGNTETDAILDSSRF